MRAIRIAPKLMISCSRRNLIIPKMSNRRLFWTKELRACNYSTKNLLIMNKIKVLACKEQARKEEGMITRVMLKFLHKICNHLHTRTATTLHNPICSSQITTIIIIKAKANTNKSVKIWLNKNQPRCKIMVSNKYNKVILTNS